MRSRNYSLDDLVFCEITKPRNPKFNNLVHRFGEVVANNIDRFSGVEPHDVIKTIQAEGNIECKPLGIKVPGYGMLIQNVPKSIAFASMSEETFSKLFKRICTHVSEHYWPECTPEQIESMAEFMDDEV